MGKKLKKEAIMNYCNPEGFKNELKKIREEGETIFFTWFDGGETVDGAYEKADDIFCRLMLPWAKKFLGDLKNKVSLDIGYGGGGQVLAASKHFKYAMGLDVHEEISYVEAELRKRQGGKNKNTALFIGNGYTIPIDANKIDFIHSWVTFLYIGTIQNVTSYLKEMFRVLKPGGVAVIFFTRLIWSKSEQHMPEYEADLIKEKQHPEGYREGGPLTRVNRPNLIMSRWKMEELAEKQGFKFLSPTMSQNRDVIYGQHGVVIQKPIAAFPSTSLKSTPSKSSSSEVNKKKPKIIIKVKPKKVPDIKKQKQKTAKGRK